jgi:PAS domain S-box-containing protein
MGLVVFQFLKNSSSDKALADALGRSQAVIEFGMDGTILTANDNFLKALGYSLGEIQGKHHSMFVDPSERDSATYRDFWAALKRGETKPPNTSGSAGAARKSGSRQPTTRCSTPAASRSRS